MRNEYIIPLTHDSNYMRTTLTQLDQAGQKIEQLVKKNLTIKMEMWNKDKILLSQEVCGITVESF